MKFGFLANKIVHRSSFDLTKEKVKWMDLVRLCHMPGNAKLLIQCRCSIHGGMCPVTGIGLEKYSMCASLRCHPVGGRHESWNFNMLTTALSETPKRSWNSMLHADITMVRQIDTARQILIHEIDMTGKSIIFKTKQ